MDSDTALSNLYQGLGDIKGDFRNANLIELIASKISGKKVLDIGCGAGHLLSRLSSLGKAVIGIEPNKDLATKAQTILGDAKILCRPAEDGLSDITEVDTITMLDVLEHIEDDGAQIARTAEILPSGGTVVIVVPAHPYLYGRRDEKYGHFRRYTGAQLRALLLRHNFAMMEMRHWNMLGVLPYWFSEKILKRSLDPKFRDVSDSAQNSLFSRSLYQWFRLVENRVSFGFGLSLIAIAKKQ